LGGYAVGELRLGYTYFGNSTINGTLPNISNNSANNLGSNTLQESVNLTSGKKFNSSGITWRLSGNNQEQHSMNGSNYNQRFRSANGEITYQVFDKVSALIQAGYYDNQYSGNIAPRNGVYLTPGLSWRPSPNFSLSAGYGINSYFTNVYWHPSERTSFELNYRNSQVGGSSNVGSGFGGGSIAPSTNFAGGAGMSSSSSTGILGANNAGSNWNGRFSHRTRTTSWVASYHTSTTTIQQVLASTPTFSTQFDASGNPISDPTAIERSINTPNLTDGIIVYKRLQGSVTWTLPKNNLMLSAYKGNNTYSTGNTPPQEILGITANWNWQINPRMRSIFYGTWQTSSYQGNTSATTSTGKTDRLSVALSINRQFSSSVSGYLEYMYTQNNSSNLTSISNALNGFGTYTANRITATLSITF
jgi:hypothetical protein